MSTATVTIPNIEIKLTVEQLMMVVHQLTLSEKAKLMQAVADSTRESELTQLIAELDFHPTTSPNNGRHKLRQDWAGALKDEAYTSVELQHLALTWRED